MLRVDFATNYSISRVRYNRNHPKYINHINDDFNLLADSIVIILAYDNSPAHYKAEYPDHHYSSIPKC